MLKVGWESCPFCHRQDIYTSTPKRLWEDVAVLLLLQPVRCHGCMRRFLRPLFATPPPKMYVTRVASKKPAQQDAPEPDQKRAA